MKHLFLIAIIIGVGILTRAETELVISGDGANKVLKGLISREMLESDTSFHWIHEHRSEYTPAPSSVAILREKGAQAQFLVFAGTWNEESKKALPEFFTLMDAAGIRQEQISLIGVDHEKKSVHELSEHFSISHLPTMIIFKEGKEAGRISAEEKDGKWDTALARIIQKNF